MSKTTQKNLAAAAVATVLVLRTCNAELKAHNDFQWPEAGGVEAPDFDPKPVCGYGLHGLLWGEGDGGLLNWDEDAKWLVVAVPADSIVSLDDGAKVKFPRGEVVYCGNREGATQLIHEQHAGPIVGLTLQSNAERNTVCTGYRGTATAGEGGTATAGEGGVIELMRYDGKRWRKVVGYVGEDGIKADTKYRLNDVGAFVEVPTMSFTVTLKASEVEP